ncbi:MAG: hypothetical protein VX347_04515 [Bacteroidota bacterium]|nr:hypothetical protein [Bacteroidota bacterium]
MDKFISQKVKVAKKDEYIYNILSDMNNLNIVVPPQVTDFKSTPDSCSFKLAGFTELHLIFQKKMPYSEISIKSKNNELPFLLNCYLNKINEENTNVIIELHIELNMMMKMMLGNQLQKFVDTVAEKIKTI